MQQPFHTDLNQQIWSTVDGADRIDRTATRKYDLDRADRMNIYIYIYFLKDLSAPKDLPDI